jgi:Fe-S cluster assembly iron-binding protein IscA
MPAPFVFTDSAAAKSRRPDRRRGNPDLKLRVFVQGGGCGFNTVSTSMKSPTKTTPP